ncbi:Exportin 7 [Linnemannia gamsii]|uniref:Exportin 7 n=1 Tax=Linnemannia gamsii TaxID=64522 RepID=A0A9P6QYC2_9FUNG|nr:Exportin 7 [Linnemannia gamsii]
MAASLDLQTLEQYCETLYNPPNPSGRIQAESLLNYHFPTFSNINGSTVSGTGSDSVQGHNPNITSPIESALLCRNLLENSTNPYALMFATSRLRSLVDDQFTSFSTAEQHGLRTFVLQYLYEHPDLQPFIISSQAQLFAIITKLGWTENQEFRTLLDQIQVFFQQGVGHRTLGVRLLTAVATEMNLPGTKNVVKHRKAAVGFRDAQLLPIFQAALGMLQSVLQSQQSDPQTEKLKEALLLLMKASLAFDFIGSSYEESSEDQGSLQVPTTWRPVFEESGYLEILWECWKAFSSPTSVLVMECLSQSASIRRSLFSGDDSRHVYIYRFMQEIMLTLTTAAGQNKLRDSGNFHEFCRMLSRFKMTYQLSEVCSYKDIKQWLSAVGEFTAQGFLSWKWSPNSVPYLLTFWNKTVGSLSSVTHEIELHIEAITVNLTVAYLKSCLECVHAVMDGEADDPLESEEALLVSLDMFANIARTKHTESGRLLVNEFNNLSIKYRELIQTATSMGGASSVGSTDIKESLLVVELKLTWLMYQSTSEQDQMDGEFACEILGFIHQLQVWTAQRPLYFASPDAHLHIQSAIIYFYQQFRATYIGEESSKAVKVYTQLSSRWGLNTPNQVLNVIMDSALNNLRSNGDPAWRNQEDLLVLRTLGLFTNLASGYSSVKYIRKLDTTRALLKNHSAPDFKFLDPTRKSSDTAVARCRTIYYTMLSRILFAEDNIDAEFWRFIKPWEATLDRVALAFVGGGDLGEEDIRLILLGMFKDLRGFVTSITNRRQYNLFYEWFYPAYTHLVLRAIEIWPQNEIGIPILRFWLEFVTNKSSRVTFDSSSPNGILLFRETSHLLTAYGSNLLSRPITDESMRWSEKYKGIMLYFNILSASLSGKYTNFGVFKLYGDKALDRVLDIFFQLMLAIPVDDMTAFPKLGTAFFNVIDVFAADHMTGMLSMPQSVLEYIFRAVGESVPLLGHDSSCSTMACSAIDKICSFVLNWLIKNKTRTSESADIADEMLETDEIEDPVRVARNRLLSTGSINGAAAAAAASAATGARGSVDLTGGATSLLSKQQQQQQDGAYWLVEYVLRNKDVMTYLLVVLFNVVVFENRNNHWALSRPLLGLILLNRDFFTEYTNTFVQAQLPDRQEPLQKLVSGLMEGIETNLTTANRDRFTTNANAFRRECSQMTLMPVSPDDSGIMA